jgi:aryl-alcohol dehydrogenase-like predicted oxidoreductase
VTEPDLSWASRAQLDASAFGSIGFGAMNLSVTGRPDRGQAVETIHAALDVGIRLVDTADAYCLDDRDTGHNETLVAEALASWPGDRDAVIVATKGGHTRTRRGGWALDGRPEHLRAACDASLRRLGVDCIDLYQFHRPDPRVPFAESVGALHELRAAGKVRAIGVSNVDLAQIDLAARLGPLAAAQNELSLTFTSSIPEAHRCAQLGIPFLAWAPLGGRGAASRVAGLAPELQRVASRYGASPQRVALAWVRAQAPSVVPIPGATRRETITDSAAAADLVLDDDALRSLSAVAGVAS